MVDFANSVDILRARKRQPFRLLRNGFRVITIQTFSPNNAGWSSPVAREAHNLEVVSSNLAPATQTPQMHQLLCGVFSLFALCREVSQLKSPKRPRYVLRPYVVCGRNSQAKYKAMTGRVKTHDEKIGTRIPRGISLDGVEPSSGTYKEPALTIELQACS